MGQVRDGLNDVEGLAQWIGRKVNNHQPMAMREARGQVVSTKSKFAKPAVVKAARGLKAGAQLVAQDRTKVIYRTGAGKLFEMSVREVSEEEVAELKLAPVGR